MSRDLASSLRQDRKDKQRAAAADGNPSDESALLIGSPSRGQTSTGQPEKTSEQLDSTNESPALIGHDASSLEQERRAEEGEVVSMDESCSHVMEQQQAVQDQVQQLQAVQDQVQQLEPDWETRRQEKSCNEAARFMFYKNTLYFGLAFLTLSG
jgi:chromosome segregation ATPase